MKTLVNTTVMGESNPLLSMLFGGSGRNVSDQTKKFLDQDHRDSITTYEDEYNSKVIFLDFLTKKPNMFDSYIYNSSKGLDAKDALEFIKIMRTIPQDRDLDIVLHTEGGDPLHVSPIINAMSIHKGKIRVHIPYCVKSGGILIALAADEIYMDKYAYLGQIDTQYLSEISTSNIDPSTSWISDLLNMSKLSSDASTEKTQMFVRKICAMKNIHNGDLMCEVFASGKYEKNHSMFVSDIQENNLLKNMSTDLKKDLIILFEERKELNTKA